VLINIFYCKNISLFSLLWLIWYLNDIRKSNSQLSSKVQFGLRFCSPNYLTDLSRPIADMHLNTEILVLGECVNQFRLYKQVKFLLVIIFGNRIQFLVLYQSIMVFGLHFIDNLKVLLKCRILMERNSFG
jgi:hypothetical protein